MPKPKAVQPEPADDSRREKDAETCNRAVVTPIQSSQYILNDMKQQPLLTGLTQDRWFSHHISQLHSALSAASQYWLQHFNFSTATAKTDDARSQLPQQLHKFADAIDNCSQLFDSLRNAIHTTTEVKPHKMAAHQRLPSNLDEKLLAAVKTLLAVYHCIVALEKQILSDAGASTESVVDDFERLKSRSDSVQFVSEVLLLTDSTAAAADPVAEVDAALIEDTTTAVITSSNNNSNTGSSASGQPLLSEFEAVLPLLLQTAATATAAAAAAAVVGNSPSPSLPLPLALLLAFTALYLQHCRAHRAVHANPRKLFTFFCEHALQSALQLLQQIENCTLHSSSTTRTADTAALRSELIAAVDYCLFQERILEELHSIPLATLTTTTTTAATAAASNTAATESRKARKSNAASDVSNLQQQQQQRTSEQRNDSFCAGIFQQLHQIIERRVKEASFQHQQQFSSGAESLNESKFGFDIAAHECAILLRIFGDCTYKTLLLAQSAATSNRTADIHRNNNSNNSSSSNFDVYQSFLLDSQYSRKYVQRLLHFTLHLLAALSPIAVAFDSTVAIAFAVASDAAVAGSDKNGRKRSRNNAAGIATDSSSSSSNNNSSSDTQQVVLYSQAAAAMRRHWIVAATVTTTASVASSFECTLRWLCFFRIRNELLEICRAAMRDQAIPNHDSVLNLVQLLRKIARAAVADCCALADVTSTVSSHININSNNSSSGSSNSLKKKSSSISSGGSTVVRLLLQLSSLQCCCIRLVASIDYAVITGSDLLPVLRSMMLHDAYYIHTTQAVATVAAVSVDAVAEQYEESKLQLMMSIIATSKQLRNLDVLYRALLAVEAELLITTDSTTHSTDLSEMAQAVQRKRSALSCFERIIYAAKLDELFFAAASSVPVAQFPVLWATIASTSAATATTVTSNTTAAITVDDSTAAATPVAGFVRCFLLQVLLAAESNSVRSTSLSEMPAATSTAAAAAELPQHLLEVLSVLRMLLNRLLQVADSSNVREVSLRVQLLKSISSLLQNITKQFSGCIDQLLIVSNSNNSSISGSSSVLGLLSNTLLPYLQQLTPTQNKSTRSATTTATTSTTAVVDEEEEMLASLDCLLATLLLAANVEAKSSHRVHRKRRRGEDLLFERASELTTRVVYQGEWFVSGSQCNLRMLHLLLTTASIWRSATATSATTVNGSTFATADSSSKLLVRLFSEHFASPESSNVIALASTISTSNSRYNSSDNSSDNRSLSSSDRSLLNSITQSLQHPSIRSCRVITASIAQAALLVLQCSGESSDCHRFVARIDSIVPRCLLSELHELSLAALPLLQHTIEFCSNSSSSNNMKSNGSSSDNSKASAAIDQSLSTAQICAVWICNSSQNHQQQQQQQLNAIVDNRNQGVGLLLLLAATANNTSSSSPLSAASAPAVVGKGIITFAKLDICVSKLQQMCESVRSSSAALQLRLPMEVHRVLLLIADACFDQLLLLLQQQQQQQLLDQQQAATKRLFGRLLEAMMPLRRAATSPAWDAAIGSGTYVRLTISVLSAIHTSVVADTTADTDKKASVAVATTVAASVDQFQLLTDGRTHAVKYWELISQAVRNRISPDQLLQATASTAVDHQLDYLLHHLAEIHLLLQSTQQQQCESADTQLQLQLQQEESQRTAAGVQLVLRSAAATIASATTAAASYHDAATTAGSSTRCCVGAGWLQLFAVLADPIISCSNIVNTPPATTTNTTNTTNTTTTAAASGTNLLNIDALQSLCDLLQRVYSSSLQNAALNLPPLRAAALSLLLGTHRRLIDCQQQQQQQQQQQLGDAVKQLTVVFYERVLLQPADAAAVAQSTQQQQVQRWIATVRLSTDLLIDLQQQQQQQQNRQAAQHHSMLRQALLAQHICASQRFLAFLQRISSSISSSSNGSSNNHHSSQLQQQQHQEQHEQLSGAVIEFMTCTDRVAALLEQQSQLARSNRKPTSTSSAAATAGGVCEADAWLQWFHSAAASVLHVVPLKRAASALLVRQLLHAQLRALHLSAHPSQQGKLNAAFALIAATLTTCLDTLLALDQSTTAATVDHNHSSNNNSNNSSNSINTHVEVLKCFHLLSRIFARIAHTRSLEKHVAALAPAVVCCLSRHPAALAATAAAAAGREVLFSGFFAFFEKCSQQQKTRMFAMLTAEARALMQQMHQQFLRDFKFVGK